MKRSNSIFILCLFMALTGYRSGFAQDKKETSVANPATPPVAKDSTDDDDNKREFIPALEFGSNYLAKGRASAKPTPYISPSFTYNAKSGFTTGFNAYKLAKLPDAVNELDLNAGYDLFLGDNFQGSATYTRMIFPKYTKPTAYERALSNYQNNIDLFAGYDLTYVTPGLRFDYYNGTQSITGPKGKVSNTSKSNDFFVTLEIYHSFEIDNLFKTKGDLVIEPDYSLVGGTKTLYGETFTTKKKRILNSSSSGATPFDLSDMELDLPFKYAYHKFTFAPEVDYVYIFAADQNPTNQTENAAPTQTPASGFFKYVLTLSLKF